MLSASCYIDTQRYPGVLDATEEPLPPGMKETYARGPEEAYVLRHSDLISVREAETLQVQELRWYDKRVRISAGSWVYSGPNGHVDIILPGLTQVTMRGSGAGVVGSDSRREPAFTFVDVDYAAVMFGERGQVALPGGARLEAYSGPFVLERPQEDVIRLSNQSGDAATVAYRDEMLTLGPSETVDLALLASGTKPFEIDPDYRPIFTDGGEIQLRGDVNLLTSESGTRLRAAGDSRISGYGLVLQLEPGDEVLFEGLGSASERAEAAAAAAAESATDGSRGEQD